MIGAFLIGALAIGAAPSERVHRAAIIVGVNESFESSQPELRYADDDAARYFEMLAPSLDRAELLTVLDDESQRLYPEAAARAKPPSEAELALAIGRVLEAGKVARESGVRAEMYFIYTGHGRTKGGEGEVKLLGGVLNRTELTRRVLETHAHDRIHVIIDACNAYHLVSARGPEGSAPATAAFDEAFERFVEEHSLDKMPAVGVVLSTNGAGATHEWSRLRGGVFSHEIRSALSGAADANSDGRVDYAEIEAFLAAANRDVPELRGRPKVFVRAPAIERSAAVYAVPSDAPVLELPAALAGHYWLEDDRGVRYAELNKAEGHPVALALVPRASYALVAKGGFDVARFDAPKGRVTVELPLAPLANAREERGSPDEEPQGLFAEPFGPRFVDGFRAHLENSNATSLVTNVDRDPTPLKIAGLAAGGLALVAVSASIWQAMEAKSAYDRADGEFRSPEIGAARGEGDAASDRALALGLTAGVSAAAAAILMFVVE